MTFKTLMIIHESLYMNVDEAEVKHKEARAVMDNFRIVKEIDDWGSNVKPEDKNAYEALRNEEKRAREAERDFRMALADFEAQNWE